MGDKIILLTEEQFHHAPLWRFDDVGDEYHPISSPEELPENINDLRIKAKFYTPTGLTFDGYIVGFERNVFSIAIFSNKKMFHFNKGAPRSLLVKQFEGLIATLSGEKVNSIDGVFPVKYETQFNWEKLGYNNFQDEFNPFS